MVFCRTFLAGFFALSCLLLAPPQLYASVVCDGFSANGKEYWAPHVYRDKTNSLQGSMVDTVEEALARIGHKLEVKENTSWNRMLYNLEQNDVDMIIGAYWNLKNSAKFFYSEPISTKKVNVFVKTGREFSLSSYQDLKTREGLTLLGGSHGEKFDAYAAKNLSLSGVMANKNIIKMLSMGRADYGIMGRDEGMLYIEKLGLKGQVVALPKVLVDESVYVLFSFAAKCAEHFEQLNIIFREMRHEGLLDKYYQNHVKQAFQ